MQLYYTPGNSRVGAKSRDFQYAQSPVAEPDMQRAGGSEPMKKTTP
jgi:hypothetical protein